MLESDLQEGTSFRIHNVDFIIEKKISQGGFGTSYLIRSGGFRCVLKSMIFDRDKHFMNTSEYQALINESKIGLKLPLHPNLVTYMTFDKSTFNQIYTVTEYVEDGTLEKLIGENGIDDFKLILDLAIDITSGMEHLHSNGVIHRDLAPSNILLKRVPMKQGGSSYVAMIIDLGIAYDQKELPSSFTGQLDNTATSIQLNYGNPDYISPEQLKNDPSGAKQDTDIFAFGMLLSRMITGRKPIEQDELVKIFSFEESTKLIKRRVFSTLESSRPDLNKESIYSIGTLVTKCLHYSPEHRWKEEKDKNNFKYFGTIKEELLKIRISIYKTYRQLLPGFSMPDHVYQMRGAGLLDLKEYEGAKNSLLESLIFDCKNVNTLCNLGIAYQHIGDYDTALKYFDTALGYKVDDALIFVYIANVFYDKGISPSYVLEYLDKALNIDPSQYDALHHKGVVLYNSGNRLEACNYLKKASEIDKRFPIVEFYLGMCYSESDDIIKYEQHFEEYIKDSGHSEDSYFKVIEFLYDNKKLSSAMKFCSKGLDRNLHFGSLRLHSMKEQISRMMRSDEG